MLVVSGLYTRDEAVTKNRSNISHTLSEEERRDTLNNNKSLSMLLQNPYLIIPEIVRMSKHLKQHLAEIDKLKSKELNGHAEELNL